MKKPTQINGFGSFLAILVLVITMTKSGLAQNWGTDAGLLQGEHLQRVNLIFNEKLESASGYTPWIPIGTFQANLAGERAYAPTCFTVFYSISRTGIENPGDPIFSLIAQVALLDTLSDWKNFDGSLQIHPVATPLTVEGQYFKPVPVYGGGWLRFKCTSTNKLNVKIYLLKYRD